MSTKEVGKKIGYIVEGAKEIEWFNKRSGVELGSGPEGSTTRRISIITSAFDDSPAKRIRSRLVVADKFSRRRRYILPESLRYVPSIKTMVTVS